MWSILLKLLIHAHKRAKLSFVVVIPLPQSHINRLCWSCFFRFHSQSPCKKRERALRYDSAHIVCKVNQYNIYSRFGINSRGKCLCAFKYHMIYVRRLKMLHASAKLNATTYSKPKPRPTHNIHSIISLCVSLCMRVLPCCRICKTMKTPKN